MYEYLLNQYLFVDVQQTIKTNWSIVIVSLNINLANI